MTKHVLSLRGIFEEMADGAALQNLPPPVLTTDIFSARILAEQLEADLPGFYCRDSNPADFFAQYNGVKIAIRERQTAVPESGFREYFGELADIYV